MQHPSERRTMNKQSLQQLLISFAQEIERVLKARIHQGQLVSEEKVAYAQLNQMHSEILQTLFPANVNVADLTFKAEFSRKREVSEFADSLDASKSANALFIAYRSFYNTFVTIAAPLEKCVKTGLFGYGNGKDALLLTSIKSLQQSFPQPGMIHIDDTINQQQASASANGSVLPNTGNNANDAVSEQFLARLDKLEKNLGETVASLKVTQDDLAAKEQQLALVTTEKSALVVQNDRLTSQIRDLTAQATSFREQAEAMQGLKQELEKTNKTTYPMTGVLLRILNGKIFTDRYNYLELEKQIFEQNNRLDLYQRFQLSKKISPAQLAFIIKLAELRDRANNPDLGNRLLDLIFMTVANGSVSITQMSQTEHFHAALARITDVNMQQDIRSFIEDDLKFHDYDNKPRDTDAAKMLETLQYIFEQPLFDSQHKSRHLLSPLNPKDKNDNRDQVDARFKLAIHDFSAELANLANSNNRSDSLSSSPRFGAHRVITLANKGAGSSVPVVEPTSGPRIEEIDDEHDLLQASASV